MVYTIKRFKNKSKTYFGVWKRGQRGFHKVLKTLDYPSIFEVRKSLKLPSTYFPRLKKIKQTAIQEKHISLIEDIEDLEEGLSVMKGLIDVGETEEAEDIYYKLDHGYKEIEKEFEAGEKEYVFDIEFRDTWQT